MRAPHDEAGTTPGPLVATLAALALLSMAAACTPTVKVEAPDKPIVINLNVKIQHEVRVKVEKDAEQLLKQQPGLF